MLIVGLGSAGARYLRIARDNLTGYEFGVLRSSNSNDSEQQNYRIIRNFLEVEEFKPSLAIICSPSPFHIETAQFLAEMGTHILIEKPISNSILGVKKLVDTCQQNSLVLMTGYNLRYLHSLKYFRDCITSNKIGKIRSIRCEVGQYLPDWRPDKNYRDSVTASKALGGGALLELSHELDYLQWLFGNAEWVSAFLGKQSELEIDVEDIAHLVIGFSSERLGYRTIGNLSLDLFRRDKTRNCLVIGDFGTIKWDGIQDNVSMLMPEDLEWKIIYQGNSNLEETYVQQLDKFIGSVDSLDIYNSTGIDGLRVLELVAAARESSKNGCRTMVKREAFKGAV
jgi:predicted dehydrogenase